MCIHNNENSVKNDENWLKYNNNPISPSVL